MLMNRNRARALGHETVAILEAGQYTSPSGQTVDIRGLLRTSVDGTHSYPAGTRVPAGVQGVRPTRISVRNQTTLVAARGLADEGYNVAALNFASAKNPGGGFLGGARAQEESLARSSGLYAAIQGNPMYAFHQARSGGMYSDYTIYSPAVPVFRTDGGDLLETPWTCAFVTCPAVNAKVVLARRPHARDEIRRAMAERVDKVLAIAAHHGHDAYVLGAWGCGAFGNNGRDIAGLFAEALSRKGPYARVFREVVFAVIDWSEERRFIGPFEQQFGKA